MHELTGKAKHAIRRILPRHTPSEDLAHQVSELSASVRVLGDRLNDLGDRVCPLCENRVLQFLPAGVQNRPNVRCPYCDSWERHRMLWLYMREHVALTEGMDLLHFAPEKCLREKFGSRNGVNYVTADLFREDVDARTDIQDLVFEDEAFDLIVCSHVLEHIPDDFKAIAELHRVLRKGGTMIVMVPIRAKFNTAPTYEDPNITDPKAREREFGQFDHVRWYGCDLISRLERPGLAVTQIDYLSQFSKAERRLYGLPVHDYISRCERE